MGRWKLYVILTSDEELLNSVDTVRMITNIVHPSAQSYAGRAQYPCLIIKTKQQLLSIPSPKDAQRFIVNEPESLLSQVYNNASRKCLSAPSTDIYVH